MSADYRLKQNLKMSLNAQIKNLIPEVLTSVPPQEEWKVGRLWFNGTIGKYQGVFVKLDVKTGLPSSPEEMEVRILGADELGPTSDGEYWSDGLFNFNPSTKISDAIDEVNEALKDLAPAEATTLRGDLSLSVTNGLKTGRISKLNGIEPDTVRMTGILDGELVNYIIIDDSLMATLPTVGFVIKSKQQSQFGKADQGKMHVFYDDSMTDTGIDLFKEFNESSRDYYGVEQGFSPAVNQIVTNVDGTTETIIANPNKNNYRSATGTLTISKVERYNDFKKWQRGSGEVNFGKLTGQDKILPGHHTFYVEHANVLGGPYKTNTSNIFYDPNKVAPVSSITKFAIATGTQKYVSGVSFYNSNISYNINLIATDAFSYTYWDKPISLIASGTNASLIDWNHTTSSLKDLTVPFWNSTIEITDHIIYYMICYFNCTILE